MSLASGTKLGPYEIQSPLGAGGMGEVYRATDTRLDRTVAIKVLVSHLSSSPELKQRMEREAKAISSLNHPHICHLYDIGSQDGTDFLVMEFLEGETLADRLRKGPMPANEILKVGIAVAEALAVAHRQGIVHRDLKPGNIMLTQGGAKLMDFGLAKPLATTKSGVVSGSVPSFTAVATLSGPSPLSPLTTAGSIVGTIQYMSPEQIEGKEADARSDIFAFGSVLYEMVAGKRPFAGKSQLSLASSILESEPEPISVLKPLTPSALGHVVTTCLQKNPEDRFQTAHDIKLQLQWIAAERTTPAASASPRAPAPGRERLFWAFAVAAAIVAGAAGMLFYRPAPKVQSIRTVINPPDKTTLNLTGDIAGPLVLSPDAANIAFVATGADGKSALWVRPMNSLEARPLPGTERAIFPFWAPDSRSIGFFADGKVKTIDLNGDAQQAVCDAQLGRGGAWLPDGTIIFSPGPSQPIVRVSTTGGTPVPITKIDNDQHTSHRWPVVLPDGKHFLYLALHHDPSKAANNTLYYASLDGRENRMLFRSQSNAIYADGYLLFARGDQLMGQAFNPGSGTLSDEPRSVVKGVVTDPSTWHMNVSATDSGLLVFSSGGSGDLQLVWLDRTGKQTGTVVDKAPGLQAARISPQGDRMALQLDVGENDIWVLDLARGVRTRLTFGPVANTGPIWSPDGKWIAYVSRRVDKFGLYRKRTDGSGTEDVLAIVDRPILTTQWTHDGKYLLYNQRSADSSHGEIWSLPLDGDRKPTLLQPHGNAGQISPDGRWLAFSSNESGIAEVYVVAYGGGQGKWQVSANGGTIPQWSADGKQLYYMDSVSSVLTVPVKESGGALQFGAPQTLVDRWTIVGLQFYDVSPDGKKILLDRVAQQVSPSVTVVTNFAAELSR